MLCYYQEVAIELNHIDTGSKSDMLCDLTSFSTEGVDADQDEIVCVMQNFYCVSSVFFELYESLRVISFYKSTLF